MQDVAELVAGRELDTLVAEKVMGLTDPPRWLDGCGRVRVEFPAYSTDIAAAWQVVEKLAMWPFVLETRYVPFRWCVKFRHHEGEADTAPLAICRAALAAVGH